MKKKSGERRTSEKAVKHSIKLPTEEEEREMYQISIPETLPILALRNTVLFPGAALPITLGRESSKALVKHTSKERPLIGVVAQKQDHEDEPEPDDLYTVGTVAKILRLITMSDGSKNIIIQGRRRFRIKSIVQEEPFMQAEIEPLDEEFSDDQEVTVQAHVRTIKSLSREIVAVSSSLPAEAAEAIEKIASPRFLIHFIAASSDIKVADKQAILETDSILDRTQLIVDHLKREIDVLKVSQEIQSKLKDEVDQQQREYLLRQQLKAIQDELGEGSSELEALRERAEEKNLPEHAQETFDREMKKLARTNPAAPDFAISRNYVDWILDLPWTEYTEDHLDIANAETVLDEDHYGLDKVKKRIIEYLAVLKLKGDMKAPILCFHGPPGVGKTSLGKSIARAVGRKFVRMSLGGVRDEAEIRGHRRAYIGALPGRILQGLKKAGSNNPVFMLDEIDKVGSSWRGDPSSALLEVLDPEQNTAFSDHYLELDYDLSKVLFVATGNFLERVPSPLRDRMEIIQITGYTQDEKIQIAKGYLVPRQIERHGLTPEQLTFDDKALAVIIDGYTRESGVRQLERSIGGVARGVAKKVAAEEVTEAHISTEAIESYLGVREFFSETAERTEVPGVATGLAWTPAGGDILFVEASVSPGTGKLLLTGKLGDVMKESAHAALSYVRGNADQLNIPADAFKYWDLHVHVPSGAVPKDGPSAGVALLSALVSIYTQRRVQHDVAMTGEVTLRGLVLPVGGIKEKVLAAKRAGIKKVLLPYKNEKDVKEIREDALEGLEVQFIKRMDEIVERVMEEAPDRDPQTLFASAKPSKGNGRVREAEEFVT